MTGMMRYRYCSDWIYCLVENISKNWYQAADNKDMGLLYPIKLMRFAEVSDAIHHLMESVLRMASEQQKKT